MVAEMEDNAVGLMLANDSEGKTRVKANSTVKGRIEEYCVALGGDRPIHSILIANNGIAAVKFIKSVRSWAYETFGVERAVLFVAMATPEDMRVNAEHIRMADQFVEVPGGTNNNNYANVQLIVEVAERTGVDAVWPGWGHASENPELPNSLQQRGIVFLGPPAGPMAALGDKVGSSIIAQAAGVPCLPWSGSSVNLPFESCRDPIPEDVYRQACVHSTEEALAMCLTIGYPAMIKASWGGGGKGIRKVHNDDEVRALFKQVQGEVPGSPIFIMRLAAQSRHLEVQLLCDVHGNVAALHSRDCSVQRRHQKIIEEGPITIASPETVRHLERGACRLAKCVGYVGVATVEYLYSMDSGDHYFLELNPRLQVEHPVTEWIASVNLPAAQLAVGMGIPLWRMPEIRRLFGQAGGGGHATWRAAADVATAFSFDDVAQVPPKGHVVAVRVTSEDPDDGFKPTSGRVQELSFRGKPDVWAYFSIKSGGGIHEFSDSQFGHLFAFGDSRSAAIANMVLTLKELQIRGEIRTNVDYAVDLLQAPEYQENRIHTGWLDSRIAMRVRTERPPWHISVLVGALYTGTVLTAARVSEYIGYLEKGQIPPKHLSLVTFEAVMNIDGSKYTISMTKKGPNSYRLRLNNSEVDAEAHTLRDGGLLIQLDGKSHVMYAEGEANGTRLLIDGRTCLLQNDNDPSRLVGETPCKLLRYLVADGSHVKSDSAYAEVEVMKMCMPLLVPASGTIHHKMAEGQPMVAGDLVAMLDLDDPSAVRTAVPFKEDLPPLGTPTAVAGKVHLRCAAAVNAASMVLAGYEHDVDALVEALLRCLDDPWLPLLQWQEAMAVLATRIPKSLRSQLDDIFRLYEAEFVARGSSVDLPASSFCRTLEENIALAPEGERAALQQKVAPLVNLAKSYEGGREGHARSIVQALFDEYLQVEELFNENTQADVIEGLRQLHKKDLSRVVDVVLSHQGVRRKNMLILRLMGALVLPNPAPYREHLLHFARLSHANHSELALRASQLLEQTKLSELRASIARSLSELEMFSPSTKDRPPGLSSGRSQGLPGAGGGGRASLEERMNALVDAPLAVEDALASMFDHSDSTLQSRAIETYVRRLYQPYLVKGSICVRAMTGLTLVATWQFWEETPPPSADSLAGLSQGGPASALGSVRAVRRWGAMLVVPYLSSIAPALQQARRVTEQAESGGRPRGSMIRVDSVSGISGTPSGCGNVVHIALVSVNDPMKSSLDSGDEEQAQERVHQLAKKLAGGEGMGQQLREAGVGEVGCILLRDEGRPPTRHCFRWSEELSEFSEQPLLRHVEPPLSNLLELEKLRAFSSMRYAPSRDRQWHMYSATERSTGVRRMFLRALLRPLSAPPPPAPPLSTNNNHNHQNQPRSPPTPVSRSSATLNPTTALVRKRSSSHDSLPACLPDSLGARTHPEAAKRGDASAVVGAAASAIQGALEELELAALDSNGRADHVHLFLSALKGLELTPGPRLSSADSGESQVSSAESDGATDGTSGAVSEDVEGSGGGGGQKGGKKGKGRAGAEGCEAVLGLMEDVVAEINGRHGGRMYRLAVAVWEVRVRVKTMGRGAGAWRIVVSNPSGHAPIVHIYREAKDASGSAIYFSPYGPPEGPLHGTHLAAPYRALNLLEKRRLVARRQATTYCYDFPAVFESALEASWAAATRADETLRSPGSSLLQACELVLSEGTSGWDAPLADSQRPPSSNAVGMVAWRMRMVTPECPEGRLAVVVANDVTHNAGSFGPQEDHFFKAVTDYACARRLPLIYLAANSGARIGVAEEVRSCFRVGWTEEQSVDKGFQYLYLTPEDYARISSSVKATELELPSGELRWVITDIIGEEDGLGVENLSGSGAIAGAYSRAYWETFTITFVTGRTVGIGAYLARLGVRCIQRLDQPIILTGFSALNKLLGREVYSSHMQLGGPKIMAANGVVHRTVNDDLEGAREILQWLSYVPAVAGEEPPVMRPIDPVDRPLAYLPDTACDPRAAISGVLTNNSKGAESDWLGGLFDRDSFMETLEGWAQTVVVGRARLGGIPVGVVAVETTTVMQRIPADPGQPDTTERVVPQAGQVWFPDSAAKTAQALQDFNREGLPLFILANWRGFSGGQRDLFEGVLQRGSLIVENLRSYAHPVFVYIPRAGELRGGAWVVVDSKINPDMVEMYADSTARGAVLEPEGMVEIKFRPRELIDAMHRLDPALAQLSREAKGTKEGASTALLQQQVKERERVLMPAFKQVAVRFAELHDTPQRMAAKGVIRAVVPWETARPFFHSRLRRRLAEERLIRRAASASEAGPAGSRGQVPAAVRKEALARLRRWFSDDRKAAYESGTAPGGELGEVAAWEDDTVFTAWAEGRKDSLEERLRDVRAGNVAEAVKALGTSPQGQEGLVQGLSALLQMLDGEQGRQLASQLREMLDRNSLSESTGNHNAV